ncbi:hypothetical protein [Reyranella sp.]|uniref:hypothetical protein n=1 Tax=Reyranella sp. TaxID=1929291 RepID=UPI003D132621
MTAHPHPWPSPTATKGAVPAAAARPIDGDTILEVSVHGLTPWRTTRDEFLHDNAAEALDWPAIEAFLARGESWHGGGGACPPWSVRVAS